MDGGPEVGLGHFIRCMALAEMLRSDFRITFVCKEAPYFLKKELNQNINFIKIQEEREFFELLNENSLVIVDGYQFKADYYFQLKKYCFKTISIQDSRRFSKDVDLVINNMPNTGKYYSGVESLTGPYYAIIREDFLKRKSFGIAAEHEYLISLGGTANSEVINRIINIIRSLDDKAEVHILTTENNITDIVHRNTSVHTDKTAEEVVKIIDRSRVCFTTAGMFALEVLSRNKKIILGALNEGQHKIGQEVKDLGFVEYVGEWNKVTPSVLRRALKFDNIEEQKISNMFDGQSGERILNEISKL